MKKVIIQKTLREKIVQTLGQASVDSFVFGSFTQHEHFHDIDIGIIGARSRDLSRLREQFEESSFPYEVDIVDFSTVNDQFKKTFLIRV